MSNSEFHKETHRFTFRLCGAQQGVAGHNHVQDGLGQVGVEMGNGGRKHDDVFGERLIRVGQATVHVADTVVSLQKWRQEGRPSGKSKDFRLELQLSYGQMHNINLKMVRLNSPWTLGN